MPIAGDSIRFPSHSEPFTPCPEEKMLQVSFIQCCDWSFLANQQHLEIITGTVMMDARHDVTSYRDAFAFTSFACHLLIAKEPSS
jgi:hypothetical protein